MGDTDSGGDLVDGFVRQVRELDDEDLRQLALARSAREEVFRSGAWRAAMEAAAHRADAYVEAWIRIGAAYLPERLDEVVQLGSEADPAEVAEWQRVARLARLAIDDALLALLTADTSRPPDIRELHAPWKAMLEAAHRRNTTGDA